MKLTELEAKTILDLANRALALKSRIDHVESSLKWMREEYKQIAADANDVLRLSINIEE